VVAEVSARRCHARSVTRAVTTPAALLGGFVKAGLQLGRVPGALVLRKPGLELAPNRAQPAALQVHNADPGMVASLPVVLDE
jgi:hypothetical protein